MLEIGKQLISEQRKEDSTGFDTKVGALKEAVQGAAGLKDETDDAVEKCLGICRFRVVAAILGKIRARWHKVMH